VSFNAEGVPIPKLNRPTAIFDRLFAGFDPTESAEVAARRHAERASVLDVVRSEAETLSPALSAIDRQKLDEYLTSVRELERRVDALGAQGQITCTVPEGVSDPGDSQGLSDALIDMMALAFECDITRVISHMWGNAGSNRDYAFIGADGGHHNTSHHAMDATNLSKLRAISRWELEQFAKLLQRLKAAPDATGTVLDNTVVFFSSEISDGDRHNHNEMPVLLAGKLGGSLSPGRHVAYGEDRFFGNLFVSLAQSFGVEISDFGDRGAGPLENLV
jgi:hypothetical protein